MKADASPAASILVVDDNQFGVSARKMILEGAGYRVETAFSGEEAWELFQKNQFDVVVTDYRMGVMDGVQLIGLIRKSGSLARIVLLSGFVGCLGITPENSGADEVVCKSSTEVPELLRAIKRLAYQPARRRPASERKTQGSKIAGKGC
ncbi:MAG TPA: response regulator [Bryobacteraceae bacterium]|nr:response regulator [Bryobacteraceae bacterium]